jgi:hypothetical protein
MLANVIEVPVPAVTATRDLTMSGPPTYGTGKFSQGLIFGTGTALGAHTPLPPFTMEGWVKKAANPGAIQVFFGEAGAAWIGVNTDGRLLAVYNYTDTNAVYLTASALNSPTGNTLPVITDNAWHHVSITVTATGGYVHVDGVYLGSSSQAPRTLRTRTANPAVRKLGGGSNTLSANDVVDDVAIYNYAARPPSDFTPPTAAHTSGETGLAMLWPLENSGANIAA